MRILGRKFIMRRSYLDAVKQAAEMSEKTRVICPDDNLTEIENSPSEPITSFETSYKSLDNTYYKNNVILRNIKRDIDVSGTYLSKENWRILHDYLKETFNCYCPGRLIKQHGVTKIIEAAEITLESITHRDKSRGKVQNIGGFFQGTLKKIS